MMPDNQDKPILYLVDASIAVTGAFIAARNTARALQNFCNVILVLPIKSTIPPEELHDFWQVEYLPIINLSKNVKSIISYLPALIKSAWQLNQRMKNRNATRLQLNDFYLMHGTLMRMFGFRGQIMTWVRCDPARFAGPLARIMLQLNHHHSNRMIVVSAFIQSLLPSNYATQILYDCHAGKPRTLKIWLDSDKKTFVYVGNYIQGKGQDIALEAFIHAAAQNATIQLCFYGGDMGLAKNRDYRGTLESKAKQSGLATRVTFNDFAKDTSNILERAYAALNFSFCESFSMTVLEACGAGVAVISTASGGPQEIIKAGSTGYIIPVGDTAAATNCILQLAQNPSIADAMGRAGAKHVRENFSPQNFRDQLLNLWALNH